MEARTSHLYQHVTLREGEVLLVEANRICEFDVMSDEAYSTYISKVNGWVGQPYLTASLSHKEPLTPGSYHIAIKDGAILRPMVTLSVVPQ
jgi:hypothetical protein